MVEDVRSAMVIFMQGRRTSLIAAIACIALVPLQEAHADWATVIARQAAKQTSKHAADQAAKDAADRLAKDARLVQQKLKKAAREIISVYRENGISGTIIRVEDCYNQSLYDPYCMYMDAAGRHLDFLGAQIFGKYYTKYYSDKLILGRSARFARYNRIRTDEINGYITIIYDSVSIIIDKEM